MEAKFDKFNTGLEQLSINDVSDGELENLEEFEAYKYDLYVVQY
jgi:hypothetical protein